jgi:hypothetical protein
MNALVQQIYAAQYQQVKEKYLAACTHYMKQMGQGSIENAPTVRKFL